MKTIRSKAEYDALLATTVAGVLLTAAQTGEENAAEWEATVRADLLHADKMLGRIADAISDISRAKKEFAEGSTIELALEHDGLAALLLAFDRIPSPLASGLTQQLADLKEACILEGTRRGVILSPGDDPNTKYWALLIAAYLSATATLTLQAIASRAVGRRQARR